MKSGWKVKPDPTTGIINFYFTDEAEKTVAEFSANPADVRLANRMDAAAADFSKMKLPDTLTTYDKELEDKICYILGESQREKLFSNLSATTVLPGGGLFAAEIIHELHDAVTQELKKRREKIMQAVERHTAKYK